ncbi:putative Organellar oligopeptidase A, chloroplastic/mitochondrial [Cocos nucifera]|uniref:Putative Organellar oligopeptidase A, chloroplastic/mitochondrial n=1 Tax=Cocos nucifera TaxID=13894 RepID=A0A8K0N7I4_COCNU|nr:putative Organellar oligopeptidase A, chloroplastic/mitochondrial [Cocos nucifera]
MRPSTALEAWRRKGTEEAARWVVEARPARLALSWVLKVEREEEKSVRGEKREETWGLGRAKEDWEISTDMEDIKTFARGMDAAEADELNHWDINFWSERLRESKYDINEHYLPFGSLISGYSSYCFIFKKEELRPYFSLPKVMDGLFNLANKLFDISIEPADGLAPVWNNDVRFYCVKDSSNNPIAYFYFDPYSRPSEKRGGAWMDEVETVFHEFGHALQHMLTKQDEGLVAGIRGIEWDAVELPSQFMENWCYQRFASIDLELHTKYNPDGPESVYDIDKRVAQRTQIIPPLPEDRFLCSFNHIFAGGYAAGYYSYKWAEVLSADAFSAFEDAGLDSDKTIRETGHRFRETILALGGGKSPLEVFVEFRGREPSPEPLLRHNGLLPIIGSA